MSRKLLGKAAIVFQHEMDHIDGITLEDVGLEIDDDFEAATDEEKEEIVTMYLDSLDIRRKEIKDQIEENDDLRQLDTDIRFIESVSKGETKLEYMEDMVVLTENNEELENGKIEQDSTL